MATPNSSATSYASAADMLDMYDIRAVADLIGDAGQRVGCTPPDPNPDPSIVEADPRLARALTRASGYLEAATLRSNRYSVADLGNLDGVSKDFLVGIVCDLAMGLLYRRRPDKGQPPAAFGEALKWLEALADGERVFSFVENEAASLPGVHVETPQQICERNLVAQEAIRYFGATGDLLRPYGAGGGCCGDGSGGGSN